MRFLGYLCLFISRLEQQSMPQRQISAILTATAPPLICKYQRSVMLFWKFIRPFSTPLLFQ